jgi:hypothetical protein
LFHALIAHSAFNVALLQKDRYKMMRMASQSYNSAIRTLLPVIGGSARHFTTTLAAIMTLMMAEVCIVRRFHGNGAADLRRHIPASQDFGDNI